MRDEPIDILKDFVDLYNREEMLAFFEFRCARAGADPVHGLCRISKPKGRVGFSYLSLTFMADAADDGARAAVDDVLAKIEADDFRSMLPAIATVVPVPAMCNGSENYVRQLDAMLQPHIHPGKPFVAERLLPALRSVMQIEASSVVWWADEDGAVGSDAAPRPAATMAAPRLAAPRLAAPQPASAPAPPPSALTSLTRRLKKYFGAEHR